MGDVEVHPRRLPGRQFVDMDEAIAARAGMSVPAIFATYGESLFRMIETAVCASSAWVSHTSPHSR